MINYAEVFEKFFFECKTARLETKEIEAAIKVLMERLEAAKKVA